MSIRLMHVEENDFRFLYQLLKERPEIANISHNRMPMYKEHVAFVRSCPYAAWYIIWSYESRLGSIYLTRQNEIGVFITGKYKRHGFASWALKEIMRLHPRPMYVANVSPKNEPSLKFFKKLGWKPVQVSFVQYQKS